MNMENGFNAGDDDLTMDDFAAELEQSFRGDELEEGDKVTGRIVAMDEQYAFLDIGAKSEGILLIDELADEEGQLMATTGDELQVTVIKTGDEIILSFKLRKRDQSREMLKQAYEGRIPVQGRVEETNKGGFSIDLGGSKAFCPISKIDTAYVENPDAYVEQTFQFRIVKFGGSGRDIVVDRAVILREEAEINAEAALADLKPGMELFGKITKIMEFGAFVTLGAVEGLVHISELSWDRVGDPNEVVSLGQPVKVTILKIDEDGKRISLSMKQSEGNPWDRYVGTEVTDGAVLTGTVMRLEKFGAFVRIKPGLEGLVHISEMSWEKRVHHPSDILSTGDEIRVKILGIDPEKRRIALGIKQLELDPWENASRELAVGQTVTGKIQTVKPAGLEILLAQGITGFMPKSMTGTGREQLAKSFSPGKDINGNIMELDAGQRRCILAVSGEDAGQDKNYREFMAKEAEAKTPGDAFGSLGKLLADAMKKKQDSESGKK